MNTWENIYALILFIVFFLARFVFRSLTALHAKKYDLEYSQRKYVNKFINLVLFILLLVGLGLIYDINVKGFSFYIASAFTLTGAALFANWSILSNITASVLLYFNSPLKIGSKIAVIDKDNPVEGIVQDITWFNVILKTEKSELIYYPTNLLITKPLKRIED